MTNIMGFSVDEGNGPVYLCSDSQSTGEHGKGVVQKLFVQGNTLMTGSGTYRGLLRVRKALYELGRNPPLKQATELILDTGKEMKLDAKDPNKRLSIFLAGIENDKPTLYDINVSGDEREPPNYQRVDPKALVFSGSGSSQTAPAIKRDFEKRNIMICDEAEGMNLCFSLGDVAGQDMYVDDKLQIGLVGNGYVRLLYHPRVNLGDDTTGDDYFNYFRANFGLSFNPKEIKDAECQSISDIHVIMNDFYTACLINCANMESFDKQVNHANTLSKMQPEKREEHEAKRRELLVERDQTKWYVSEFLDAWVSGDIDKILASLKNHQERRGSRHQSAQRYILERGKPATP